MTVDELIQKYAHPKFEGTEGWTQQAMAARTLALEVERLRKANDARDVWEEEAWEVIVGTLQCDCEESLCKLHRLARDGGFDL